MSIPTSGSRRNEDIYFLLNGITELTLNLPYGTATWEKLLARLQHLVPRPNDRSVPTSEKRWRLLASCHAAYNFLVERRPRDIYWAEHHISVREFLTQHLSDGGRYYMKPDELSQWCDSVFEYLKKVASQQVKKRAIREQQICVNALYELLELARTTSTQTCLMKYGGYLITLCQKTTLSPPNFEMNFPKLTTQECNANGGSCLVYRGRLDDGRDVAVKSYRLYERTFNTSTKTIRTFLREALFLHLLQHPNILPFAGVVHEPRRLCIITRWMINGNINEYLRKVPAAPKKELLEQVADGIDFMHQYNIVHGDLKGANVLISAEGKACISDFGAASTVRLEEGMASITGSSVKLNLEETTEFRRRCEMALRQRGKPVSLASTLSSRFSSLTCLGTPGWMAPELLLDEEDTIASEARVSSTKVRSTFASDVYSFGILAFEVYSGQIPFRDKPPWMLCVLVIEGLRPLRPEKVPDDIWGLMELCWAANPSHRPLVHEVYNRLACMPSD